MNTLHHPIRLYNRGEDDIVLMIPHEPAVYYKKAEILAQKDLTKQFVNWLRKQFPQVPNEFRYVNRALRSRRTGYRVSTGYYVNTDYHFMVYGLTRAQLMLIKLSWQFKTQDVLYATPNSNDRDQDNKFVVGLRASFEPTRALLDRIEKKKQPKPLAVKS